MLDTNEPLVSIVIPTHGRSEFLSRAINSVIEQSYKKTEIIIVDDNGNDSPLQKQTEIIVQSFHLDNITLIKNEECLGGAGARNVGIHASKGAYVAFLDDDDTFLPGKISACVDCFTKSKNESLGVVYGFAALKDEEKTISISDTVYRGNCLTQLFRNGGLIATTQMVCSRKALIEIGGFPLVPAKQDSMLLVRLFEHGYVIDCVESVLTNYFIHNGERISGTLNSIRGEGILYSEAKKYFDSYPKRDVNEITSSYHKRCLLIAFRIKEYKLALRHFASLLRYHHIKIIFSTLIPLLRIIKEQYFN